MPYPYTTLQLSKIHCIKSSLMLKKSYGKYLLALQVLQGFILHHGVSTHLTLERSRRRRVRFLSPRARMACITGWVMCRE